MYSVLRDGEIDPEHNEPEDLIKPVRRLMIKEQEQNKTKGKKN